MKVVLDTNVLISARIGRDGNPARVLKHILEHGSDVELLTSTDLLSEARRVFHYPRIMRKYRLEEDDVVLYLQLIEAASSLVEVQSVPSVIKEDPDDDRVLACAIEGEADYIVTGDPHLLTLENYEGVKIVSPRDFLSVLEEIDTDAETH